MASAAGDPSTSVEDLCANMLEDCARIKALLLKLKESLRRDKAATRLQAAARGFLARRQARAALALPLSAAAAQQQLQDAVSVDQLACHEALVVADPAPARIRSRLRPALPQLPVRTPHGVSMVCLPFPAVADQLQLLGMHLHGKTKKSGHACAWSHGLHQTTTARGRAVFEGGRRCYG